MPDLSIHQLAEIIGGQLSLGTLPPLGGPWEPVGRVVTDSQSVLPGDLFWGLEETAGMGAQFAEEAMFRAAQGTVVAGRHIEPWAGRFSIQVGDARHALLNLAQWTRQKFSGTVVGLAGGPHSGVAANLLHQLLQPSASGTCSDGALSDGALSDGALSDEVAMAMLNWHPENEYAILNLGAADNSKITAISHLCCPEIIAINSRYKNTHHQSTRDQKAFAKIHARFLDTLPRNTTIIINGDDPSLCEAANTSSLETIRVGCGCNCDVMATHVACVNRQLAFDIDGMRFQFPVWGRHYLTQTLMAIAIGRLLSVPLDAMQIAARQVRLPRSFGDLQSIAGITVIDDTQAASPGSLEAHLESLSELPTRGRRWVVCGDLYSDGLDITHECRQLGRMMVTQGAADRLICCGTQAAAIATAAVEAGFPQRFVNVCSTVKKTADRLARELTTGDVVLVSGCHSAELELVIQQFAAWYPSAAA